jgi:GNAT superfamily N-acetyltransferase
MGETLRRAVPEDAPEGGRICYEAFASIAGAHNFPKDFESPDVTRGLLRMLIDHPGFYGVVAERDGKLLGSNFMDERCPILGVGPITVDPMAQSQGVGRRLMQDVLDRATARKAAGVRLVQVAYNNRSLCLYTSLGFSTREPLSVMQGPALRRGFPGFDVRAALPADFDACSALCQEVHGVDRGGDLKDAIDQKTAMVVEHLGQITGYTTLVGFWGHSVARSNRDLMALIDAAAEFPGPGFMFPTRNHELFSWCLANGLRLVQQMTLMSIGLYNAPADAFLPSIFY